MPPEFSPAARSGGLLAFLILTVLLSPGALAGPGGLRVMAVGDIMLGTDFPRDRLPPEDGAALLAEAAPILRQADVAVGNLEGVLLDGGEPVKQCQNSSACYLFRTPARYANRLAESGFDVMSLANNHAMDFGPEGATSSSAALQALGIEVAGPLGTTASWTDEGGRRIGFVAFAPNRGVESLLDVEKAREIVARLADEHDVVIVSMHAGAEGFDAMRLTFETETYYGEDRGNPVAFARAMVDAGADLVVGHGPHVPRAMEVYQGHLIAYSLGNFCTYWGISVEREKGLAPILDVTLDDYGHLVEGRIHALVQRRPLGPVLDSRGEAVTIIRHLTALDFPEGRLLIEANGELRPRYYPGPAFDRLEREAQPVPLAAWRQER